MGLTIALHHAILTPNTSNIILYADNEAALKSLLDPRVHPSQMCSILACQRLRAWLSAAPDHHLTIAWCPGHVGIPRQEQVDTLAKASLRDNPPHSSPLPSSNRKPTPPCLQHGRPSCNPPNTAAATSLGNAPSERWLPPRASPSSGSDNTICWLHADEHAPALGSEGGIREALGRYRTALDKY
ncbi:hypothetical protein HETIRDRAFT_322591 [Heterobasidion irregulare TC 32-1]|uniref:RNase H type-1 domain-containing protein n=1 Tax=Heterobasidion irregulare (strain TC 32-1) TaxID=747525 RepID=W4K2G1_HETIT|nr:uncharacterized protein HETIRDRAFT_322591 [Heterobasidion irregulare TC 32-1]ETW79535.1 hypothetical protein HETIRDRAFT_322591 [Heterobasidion irregulare TC 32-1]